MKYRTVRELVFSDKAVDPLGKEPVKYPPGTILDDTTQKFPTYIRDIYLKDKDAKWIEPIEEGEIDEDPDIEHLTGEPEIREVTPEEVAGWIEENKVYRTKDGKGYIIKTPHNSYLAKYKDESSPDYPQLAHATRWLKKHDKIEKVE